VRLELAAASRLSLAKLMLLYMAASLSMASE
jgi:hypothetical protein